jgi:hypothetical protein
MASAISIRRLLSARRAARAVRPACACAMTSLSAPRSCAAALLSRDLVD